MSDVNNESTEIAIGSLFSGYGGLDLAVESFFDARTVWHCEFEEAPSQVLASHWGVPNFGDITEVDWEKVEPVDILTGGFPCQDVSLAGRRAGMKEGTRSGLWSEMVKAIEILEPGLVIIENVRGLLSAEAHSDMEHCAWCVGDEPDQPVLRALGAVLGDLANLGYDAQWHGLRAADIGACHGRFRVFIVAYTDRKRISRWISESRKSTAGGSNGQVGGTDFGADRGHLGMFPETYWGKYAPAVERWAKIIDREAPAPTEPSKKGKPQLSARFVEWMMGLPDGWVTGRGLTRSDELKMLGNGVVPQQASRALQVMFSE